VSETLLYDGDGTRVAKTSGGATMHYVNRWFEKKVASGVTTVHYWLGGRLVADWDSSAAPGTLWLHTDSLGSPFVTTDSAKWATSHHAYLPYGGARAASGPDYTDRDFTGQYLDSGSGLHFYNARYYGSDLARFLSPDSLVPDPNDPRSYNRYSYVTNNPLKFTDPTGHDSCQANGSCGGGGTRAPVAMPPRGMGANGTHLGNPAGTPWTQAQLDSAIRSEVMQIAEKHGARVEIVKLKPGQKAPERLPQDINVNPQAPKVESLDRPIGKSASDNNLKDDIKAAFEKYGGSTRVNQQQVNSAGERVGTNRPDVNSSFAAAEGRMSVNVEIQRSNPDRLMGRTDRLQSNDPGTMVIKIYTGNAR
jgi:RHS repeat-associated protein